MPKEDGYKNLVKKTPEELREMAKRGGQANAARIKREKTLNEVAKAMLNHRISKDKAREILGEYAEYMDGDFTLGAMLTMRQIIEAQEGSSKAYEIMRDTAGYKPIDRQEINAEIMTDQDRKLMEQIAARMGLEKQEKP